MTGKAISFYQDTASYLNGGEHALQYIQSVALPNQSADDEAPGDQGVVTESTRIKAAGFSGARSPTYSIFTYLLHGPQKTLLLLTAAQSAIFAYLLLLLLHLYKIRLNFILFIPAAIITALSTSAPWYISYAMPDIFSGFAILCIAMLVAFPAKLSLTHKILLAVITAFSVTAHTSHIPLVGGLVLLTFASFLYRRRRTENKIPFTQSFWVAVPFALAITVTMAINYIGFGDTSVVAKRFPVTLARSISDGPARWHLEKNCQKYQYAVCEIFETIPISLVEFLWGENGLRNKATADQMDRIRAEELIILKRASLEYPFRTLQRIAWNTLRQLVSFGYAELNFNQDIKRDDNNEWTVVKTRAPKHRKLIKSFHALEYLVVFSTLLLLVHSYRKKIRLRECDYYLIGIMLSGLFINAAVCGSLSTVADRYQGRVIWIFPIVIAVVAWHRYLNNPDKL